MLALNLYSISDNLCIDPPSSDLPTSLPITTALIAEVMPASHFYRYSLGLNLTDHADFSTNHQGEIINNISAGNVNTAPNFGLLHLYHHILLLHLYFNRYHQSR